MALYGVQAAALPASVARSLAVGITDAIVGAHAAHEGGGREPPGCSTGLWSSGTGCPSQRGQARMA
eukprot:15455989-Alexandrium_andersonii.AAC.1